MKISTQAIKFINEHYHSAGDPAATGVDDLVKKIGAQLGAVEETVSFGDRFQGIIIAKVISCVAHPNSDHLHICKIDDGHKAEDVDRDENGHVQVVCGAPNVREGLTVAWLPPGATVPESIAEGKEPFVLSKRDIRGQISNGMLASARELSLGDNHEGILEISQDSDENTPAPGTDFAEACHLTGDVIIDIENKMFTHRPDCFGWLGVAREIEGIYGRPYKSPEWYTLNPQFPGVEGDELKLEVRNELPELVPRFTAIVVRDIEVKPSPLWLQVDLARAGMRPINNIVDYTNFFMLETGQPLHAYDYDKLKSLSENDQATIIVRKPHDGEKILLLNGKEVQPRAEAIMIATDKQAIGIGGVMGGGETEVDEHTKNIVIECATFDMYSIRRTSMAHGLFTDAVTRFNKGQSPLQNLAVLGKITGEICRYAGGKVASPLIDVNSLPQEVQDRASLHEPVTVSRQFVNARLGFDLPTEDMRKLLENVEFRVEINDDDLVVTAPFWRTDIEIPEDIVEEIGRLYGYDHLPLQLPQRPITPAPKDPVIQLKTRIRRCLAAAGANEVLSYTFVHGNLFDKVGQDAKQAFQLSNALSPDLQYYRMSLTPSLLEKVHANVKAGYDEFALFEINKIHLVGEYDPSDPDVPQEDRHVAFVCAAGQKTAQQSRAGAAFYEAKRYAALLLPNLNSSLVPLASFDFKDDAWGKQMCAPYEPGRAAVVVKDGMAWGVVGEYRVAVRKALKLPDYAAGFELSLDILADTGRPSYQQLPRFPKVEQDICLKVAADTTYGMVFDTVWGSLSGQEPDTTYCTLEPVDIYQREDDTAHKQITLRLGIASFERTLTDDEVHKLLDHVAGVAHEKLAAERI